MIVENATSYVFYILLVVYPFLPLIKERFSALGNLVGVVLILILPFLQFFILNIENLGNVAKNFQNNWIIIAYFLLINLAGGLFINTTGDFISFIRFTAV